MRSETQQAHIPEKPLSPLNAQAPHSEMQLSRKPSGPTAWVGVHLMKQPTFAPHHCLSF